MTKSQIEAAIKRNQPFRIRMADGHEYAVPHRDYIKMSPKGTFVVVMDDEEHAWVLPLLTMTAIGYEDALSA
ncbi:MAG: hypothetical protein ACOCVG_03960 [Verrucomicrobiota bacterium]